MLHILWHNITNHTYCMLNIIYHICIYILHQIVIYCRHIKEVRCPAPFQAGRLGEVFERLRTLNSWLTAASIMWW